MKGNCMPLSIREKISEGLKRAYREGRKTWTIEAKNRLRDSKLGERNPMKRMEARKKVSQSRMGKYCGKNSPSWKGGKTLDTRLDRKYQQWRLAVYKRDNFTCPKCKQKGGCNLHAHHISNFTDYPKIRFDIDNGITLCANCHRGFHRQYGQRNNTLEQIEEYLSPILNEPKK